MGPSETYTSTGMQIQKAIGFAKPFTSPPGVYVQVLDESWGTAVFAVVVATEATGFQNRDYVANLFGYPSIKVRHNWIAVGN